MNTTKVDLVITVYRQPELWPCLIWGINQNADYLSRVIFVNDEWWTQDNIGPMEAALKDCTVPHRLLDHAHNGFGEHRSLNQGAREVTTPYFAYTNGDVVLAPNSIKLMLEDIEPDILLYGISHDTARDLTPADFPSPHLIKVDPRSRSGPGQWELAGWNLKWQMFRDCFVMCDTKNYHKIGGHDEDYPGYGFIDYDFGIRWVREFGIDNVELGRGESYHMSGLVPGSKWHPENEARFKKVLEEYLEWIEKGML